MPEDSVPAVESGTAQVSHLSPSADGALLNRDSARDGVNSSRFVLPIVLLTNANRLHNKIDELFCLVNREHFDLIAITETWLTNEVPDSVYHSVCELSGGLGGLDPPCSGLDPPCSLLFRPQGGST